MTELQDRVDKTEEKITVYVGNLRIQGHMHRHPDVRFSDEWNREHRDFVPLTDCSVLDRSTGEEVNIPFAMVRREHVNVVFPEPGGGQKLAVPGADKEQSKSDEVAGKERDSLTKRLRRIT